MGKRWIGRSTPVFAILVAIGLVVLIAKGSSPARAGGVSISKDATAEARLIKAGTIVSVNDTCLACYSYQCEPGVDDNELCGLVNNNCCYCSWCGGSFGCFQDPNIHPHPGVGCPEGP